MPGPRSTSAGIRRRHSAAAARETPSEAQDLFRRIALWASNRLGSYEAFIVALAIVGLWAISGPFFHFGDDWQLVINTGTTIVTFLMIFLVQATQNRDAKAIQLKLDELIRATRARNSFADLEDATDEELDTLEREFRELRRRGLSTKEIVRAAQHAAGAHPSGSAEAIEPNSGQTHPNKT